MTDVGGTERTSAFHPLPSPVSGSATNQTFPWIYLQPDLTGASRGG